MPLPSGPVSAAFENRLRSIQAICWSLEYYSPELSRISRVRSVHETAGVSNRNVGSVVVHHRRPNARRFFLSRRSARNFLDIRRQKQILTLPPWILDCPLPLTTHHGPPLRPTSVPWTLAVHREPVDPWTLLGARASQAQAPAIPGPSSEFQGPLALPWLSLSGPPGPLDVWTFGLGFPPDPRKPGPPPIQ